MYNIFQIIALKKAMAICDSFYLCYEPLILVGNYLEGNLPQDDIVYGKYWLLGQKISLSSLILLQQVGILPTDINTRFLSEKTIIDNAEDVSITSIENITDRLSGVNILMQQIFKISGWETDILYFSTDDMEDALWDDIPSNNHNGFLDWLFDTTELLRRSSLVENSDENSDEYFLWRFRSKRIYSSSILHKIFYNIVRFSDYYICLLPDNTMEVYVLGKESESYDDFLYDECDFSYIHLLSALYALYYSQMIDYDHILGCRMNM